MNCVICGRGLEDPWSDLGVGSECAQYLKRLDGLPLSDEGRRLLHESAGLTSRGRLGDAAVLVPRLVAEGLVGTASVLEERCAKLQVRVVVERHSDRYHVQAPRDDLALARWKQIPGRKWDGRCNTAPLRARELIWQLLREFYSGAGAAGPDGRRFVIL